MYGGTLPGTPTRARSPTQPPFQCAPFPISWPDASPCLASPRLAVLSLATRLERQGKHLFVCHCRLDGCCVLTVSSALPFPPLPVLANRANDHIAGFLFFIFSANKEDETETDRRSPPQPSPGHPLEETHRNHKAARRPNTILPKPPTLATTSAATVPQFC